MRHLIPGLAAALLGVFIVLYVTDRSAYFMILNAIHEHPFRTPFLDTRFVTAQVECWSRGVDVYAHNPCDPLGRTHDYSPLWLRLPFLARSDNWTPLFGLATDLLFLGSLFLMPWGQASVFGSVVVVCAVLSWATIFAAERGNTDLLIFAAAVLFAQLLKRSAAARCAGYMLVLGVGLLKFYPLTLLALIVREPWRRMWLIGGLCGLVLVVFFAGFHDELSRIGANMAVGFFGGMFGARGLPFGLVMLWNWSDGRDASRPEMMLLSWTLFIVMAGGCMLQAVALGRNPMLRSVLDGIGETERSLLLVGAVLCPGCFFGHQNIGYRAVLLLLVMPGLLALVRVAPRARVQWLYRLTSLLVLLVLWDRIVDVTLMGWLAVQLAWWSIVCVLLSIVVSLLGGEVAQRLGRENWFYNRQLNVGPLPERSKS